MTPDFFSPEGDHTSSDDTPPQSAKAPALPFSLLAEDGWMAVEVERAMHNPQRLTLTVRGVHGARAGKFEQSVDLTRDQRIALATALLEGTSKSIGDRGGR